MRFRSLRFSGSWRLKPAGGAMAVKIGIALGSGVARGWAHIGVLKTLADAGIRPGIIAGTSIGAVAGACFAANKLELLEEFARSMTPRQVFRYLDVNFAGSGILNGNRLGKRLEETLGLYRIEDLPTPFAAVATESGKRPGNLADPGTAGSGVARVLRAAGRLQAGVHLRALAHRRRAGESHPGVGVPGHGRRTGDRGEPPRGRPRPDVALRQGTGSGHGGRRGSGR